MLSLLFVQIPLAFGAGALLNLTPCVLPAIPSRFARSCAKPGNG